MSNQKIINPEPKLIKKIRQRKTLLKRPYRDVYLSFTEDVARQLRNRDYWVSMTASTIGWIGMSYVFSFLGINIIPRKARKR